MKSKDQILLENIYSKKVLKENFPKIPSDGYADGGEPYEDDELEAINSEQSKIKLIVIDGTLYTPYNVASDELKKYYDNDMDREGLILAGRDETGDVITARWPNYNPKNLAITLYDARETGQIPSNTTSVLLPDGTEFEIDSHGI